jgi:hypothetical protein
MLHHSLSYRLVYTGVVAEAPSIITWHQRNTQQYASSVAVEAITGMFITPACELAGRHIPSSLYT